MGENLAKADDDDRDDDRDREEEEEGRLRGKVATHGILDSQTWKVRSFKVAIYRSTPRYSIRAISAAICSAVRLRSICTV
jgi:hypothetical protein